MRDFKEETPLPHSLGYNPDSSGFLGHHINNKSELGKVGGGVSSLLFALFLIHLLHFHPPVLKPDFNLSLTQIEESGHLVPAVPGEVHIEQKLLL